MSSHQTLRERIALESQARENFMADRLRRHQAEMEAEGLRDLKDGDYRATHDDERAAMAVVGGWAVLILLALLGVFFGFVGASWWMGNEFVIANALECVK